ncbi:formin-like protein 18 isoform X1 [Salvia splendens]|uniref:formin-like protein 18 isoform X1 n=1 Tax=Salvia splendens TaxID=180675 RepID=UPI001C278CB0|nr:formin-like protein 18 isoform X1 [Salvia splendens]XP_042054644.1 formin-like protein 18 isoform X1 [Salvia splendens]
MALFRKLFYRKPPDGLLEICERVYVFDCCFTTDSLEKQDYKGYVGGIVSQLRENYPDSSILAFNFREGETQTEIGSVLTEYDMTVMEYPRQYEGCPLLPMEVVHHFLKSSESWLSLGIQNLLLMHCECGGWPVLAFMLAALLIYRKHYSGELKTLDMVHKQAPRELLYLMSPLNPIPSQLRYLQYVTRRNVAIQWPPIDRALTLDCIIMRMIPNFDGKGGCRPIFRIYGQDPFSVSERAPKVLFSTPKRSKAIRHYQQGESEIIKVDLNCHIQGDVVLECISLNDDMEREKMMFRVMFNTAFIRSNILMLNKDDIDILWNAKEQFPKDFRSEVLFSEDTTTSLVRVNSSCFEEKDGLPEEAFAKVREMFNSVDWLVPKGDSGVEVLKESLAALDVQSLSKSQTSLSSENQSDLSPKFSQNTDTASIQADHQFSPTDTTAVISSKLTLIPSGDHSPPSLTSPHHQFSITKTLHLSPRQQYETKAEAKDVSPLCAPKETSYAKTSPTSAPSQSARDAGAFFGPSPCSQQTSPFTHSKDKIGSVSASHSIPLLPLEIASGRSFRDENICMPDILSTHTKCPKSQDRVVEDELSKSEYLLSSAFSAEDLPESPKAGTPPTPPVSDLHAAPTGVKSASVCGPAQPAPIPSPPPQLPPPPKESCSGGESTPLSGVGASPSIPSMGHSSGVVSVPCPPPPPQLPEEISGGGGPLCPIPPLHPMGPNTPPYVSPPQPPPPPAIPTTKSSSSVPSAPPPPHFTNNAASGGSLPGVPSPPPPLAPPPGTKGKALLSRTQVSKNNQSKKLKPLHWLKISKVASGSLWAETQKSEASKAPEIDISELESLFSAAVPNKGQGGRKTGSLASISSKPEKVQLIEHRRAYNCEIMLSKVKIPLQDMLSSVLSLEDSALDVDQVDNLIKFCPTKDEMEVLKSYKGVRDNLGKCEQFFLDLMHVPRIEHKLRVYSFKIQFRGQVSDLRKSLDVVNSASDQIRGSAKLKRIMQTILSLGNALNQGTARGSAVGFRLDSLLKLTETRALNNKMTLMHYLCKVLSDKLPELLDFWQDLSSLEDASKIQLKFLAEEMQAINKGLEKVMQELSMAESDGPVSEHFCQALKEFLCFSEGEVRTLASLYATVGRNVDSLILYFGEDPARCQFEQVISTLSNFAKMFKHSHEENCKQLEFEKKKAEKEGAAEPTKMNASDTGHLLQSQVNSVN